MLTYSGISGYGYTAWYFIKITDLYTLKGYIRASELYLNKKNILKHPKQNISKQNPVVHIKKHSSRPMGFIVEIKNLEFYLEIY